jgi:predicted dehydrogenase
LSAAGQFRWAILGTGAVSRKFVLDLKHAGASAQVVASRDPANAARFARTLSVPQVAQDYAEAVASPEVDAVYIATPPALHKPHALMALAAGKPVLVEKPFARNAAEAREIVAAADAAGLPCIEALWTRFQPFAGVVSEAIAAGRLGELRGFDARFMAANAPTPGSGLFDPDLGGGALLHRGVYPLSLARHFLGPVEGLQATARIGETGVDEDSVLVLRHAGGALSTIRASLRAEGPDGAVIHGTRGSLHLEGPIYRPTGAWLKPTVPAVAGGTSAPRRFEAFRESGAGLRLSRMLGRLRARRAGERLPVTFRGNGYHYEAAALMDCVRAGRSEPDAMPRAQSVEVMDLIDRARTEWGMPL